MKLITSCIHQVSTFDECQRIIKGQISGAALVVSTKGAKERGFLSSLLQDLTLTIHYIDNVPENPSFEYINEKIKQIKPYNINGIIAIGGGSVIDCAKVINSINPDCNTLKIKGLKHTFHQHQDLLHRKQYPLIAIPTTSGTGSEVTPFATIWDQEILKKESLSHKHMQPSHVCLYPELTITVPLSISISTGLDALSQALESVWSKKTTTRSRINSFNAITILLKNLPLLQSSLHNIEIRRSIQYASMLAGLAIAETRTGIAHSISYPLTAHFGVPHGIACSFTLKAILSLNIKSDDGRFSQLMKHLSLQTSQSLVKEIEKILYQLKPLKVIKEYIHEEETLYNLIDEMFTPGRSDNNFIKIKRQDIFNILKESFINKA